MAEQTLNERPERLPAAFDGTELIEVFPTSEGKSYKSPVGTAASKNVGTGADDVPQNSDLGSAAYLEAGTDPDNVPQNSDLGGAAYLATGSGQAEVVINSGLLRTRTVTAATTVELTDHLGCIVVDAATADITVPDTLPVGFRFKVLKISSYDTTNTDSVNILTSGTEVATVAQLTTVPLYGNGGNWTLEKVSSTRWEIVAGWDAGENSNGTWSRDSAGGQKNINNNVVLEYTSSDRVQGIMILSPELINKDYEISAVVAEAFINTIPNAQAVAGGLIFRYDASTPSSAVIEQYRATGETNFSSGDTLRIAVVATGRWYALS